MLQLQKRWHSNNEQLPCIYHLIDLVNLVQCIITFKKNIKKNKKRKVIIKINKERKEKKLSSFPTPLQFLNFKFKVFTSKLLPSPSRYISRSGEQLPLRHMLIFRLAVDILAKYPKKSLLT